GPSREGRGAEAFRPIRVALSHTAIQNPRLHNPRDDIPRVISSWCWRSRVRRSTTWGRMVTRHKAPIGCVQLFWQAFFLDYLSSAAIMLRRYPDPTPFLLNEVPRVFGLAYVIQAGLLPLLSRCPCYIVAGITTCWCT